MTKTVVFQPDTMLLKEGKWNYYTEALEDGNINECYNYDQFPSVKGDIDFQLVNHLENLHIDSLSTEMKKSHWTFIMI